MDMSSVLAIKLDNLSNLRPLLCRDTGRAIAVSPHQNLPILCTDQFFFGGFRWVNNKSGALIFNSAPSRALRLPGACKSQRCGKTVTHSRTQRVALRSEDSAISSATNKSFRIPIAHPILSLRSFSRIFGGELDRGG